ncbi:acyl-CoA N-acyltransferase, partial [Tilletiopsis washingtonensis]
PPSAAERAAPLRVRIRKATPADIPTILGFIRDLALYEEALEQAKATPELLQTNVFDKQYAHCLIAEQEEDAQPVGMALYFFSFSTWEGKPSLYLEDLYVSPAARNRGAGKALFRALGGVAEERGCARIDWSVLTWNAPSIAFYTQVLGADMMQQWRTCRLEGEGIKKL